MALQGACRGQLGDVHLERVATGVAEGVVARCREASGHPGRRRDDLCAFRRPAEVGLAGASVGPERAEDALDLATGQQLAGVDERVVADLGARVRGLGRALVRLLAGRGGRAGRAGLVGGVALVAVASSAEEGDHPHDHGRQDHDGDEGDQLVTAPSGAHEGEMPRRVDGQTGTATARIGTRSSFRWLRCERSGLETTYAEEQHVDRDHRRARRAGREPAQVGGRPPGPRARTRSGDGRGRDLRERLAGRAGDGHRDHRARRGRRWRWRVRAGRRRGARGVRLRAGARPVARSGGRLARPARPARRRDRGDWAVRRGLGPAVGHPRAARRRRGLVVGLPTRRGRGVLVGRPRPEPPVRHGAGGR